MKLLLLACVAATAVTLRPNFASAARPSAMRMPDRMRTRTPFCTAQGTLPPGWREVFDNGQNFFFNDATGESQWEAPLAQHPQYGFANMPPVPGDLLPGWREVVEAVASL